MSLPRKGCRTITVDGERYRWVAAYERVLWCSAPCPVRLMVERHGGRGQLLIALFHSRMRDANGQDWVFPRYGSELTPAKVAEIIRAGRAAGWNPGAVARPPLEIDGEPFLRLPTDATEPPPGSEDDLKQSFLGALREQVSGRLSKKGV